MSDFFDPEQPEEIVDGVNAEEAAPEQASAPEQAEEPATTEQEAPNTTETSVEKSDDGTYSYSYRKAVENPEEYRKPPYMRDEVGKGSPTDGEPQVRPRLKEFKGIQAGGQRSNPEEQRRQSYDSDPYTQRRSYGNSSNKKPKKNGKQFAMIAAIAILVGGLVASACWSVGKLINSTSNTSALEELQKDMEEGNVPSGAQPSEAAGDSASGESAASGESVIPKNPSGEVSADSTLITGLPDVVDLALPSVVAITTKTVYESYSQYGNNPFFGGYGYGGSETYEVEGAGSGIIIGDDGTELWIVTNNHVAEDSKEVTVSFCDDEAVAAYIKGTDPSNDLAVVGVKIADLSDSTKSQIRAIQMGDSDSLRLGETVIAIGNALGIGQSVTTGIVSALNREITTDENTTLTTIQTDAAINPGNSGGALLNSAGELIGINVAKGTSENVEGMGYAIPISNARSIIEKLTTMEPRVPVSEDEYPYLGVQLKDISSSYAEAYGIPQGVLVYALGEGTPAEKGGMISHDIITKFEDVTVTTYDELVAEMQYYSAGTTVTVTVSRLEDGTYVEKELSITLGRKADYEQEETQPQG